MITLATARWNASKTLEYPRSCKKIVNGYEDRSKPLHEYIDQYGVHRKVSALPYWFEETRTYEGSKPLLYLYNTILDIEKNNKAEILLAEKVIRKEPDELFRTSVKDKYLEDSVLRNWILIDYDEGTDNCNSLTIRQRLDAAIASLPETVRTCAMVVRLSNKAFLPTYPHYMGLHIYVELSKPTTNARIKEVMKGVPGIDASIYTNGRKHYLQAPEVVGSVKRSITGDTCIYVEGTKLDLDALEEDPEVKKHKKQVKQSQKVLHGLKDFTKSGNTSVDDLKALAEEGYYEKVTRHTEHYRILKAAEYTGQNGEAVKEAIIELGSGDGTVLGNRASRDTLEAQLEQVQRELTEAYSYDLEEQPFEDIILDDKYHDLSLANTALLKPYMVEALRNKKRLGVQLKAPHGSGKTTVIFPELQEALREVITHRKPRILYISSYRSIITGVTKKLQIACYITVDGVIEKSYICDQDELGICIRSILYIEDEIDGVYVDESEHVAFWAAWDGGTGNSHGNIRIYGHLTELLAQSKIFILADADSAQLSYTLLRAATKNADQKTLLYKSNASWILHNEQKVLLYRTPTQVWNQLFYDAVHHDKFCFVHTDFKDSDAKPHMTATVNAINKKAGRRIAIGFDSSTNKKRKRWIGTYPNRYIRRLYKIGIRIIIVSPIIVQGWRYSDNPHFDATYGIYTNRFFGGDLLVQRTQRVTHCGKHHMYINPSTSWTNHSQLMADVKEELGFTDIDWYEKKLVTVRQGKQAKDLIAKAEAKKALVLDNPKLHFIVAWKSFGGMLEIIEYDEEEDVLELGAAISGERLAEKLRIAQTFLDDDEKLEELKYCFPVGTPIGHVEEVVYLLEELEKCNLTIGTATEVCRLLSSSEQDWRSWGLQGAPWQVTDIRDIAAAPYLYSDRPTFVQLGNILNELERQLHSAGVLKPDLSLLNFLSGNMDYKSEDTRHPPLVIHTDTLDKEPYTKIANRYRDIMKTRYSMIFGNGAIAIEKVMKQLFQKVLLCKVTVGTPENVTEAKHQLVQYYQENKIITSKAKPSTRKLQEEAALILCNRIRQDYDLSGAENNYVKNTGKILIIRLPSLLTTRRAELYKWSSEATKYRAERIYDL